MLITMCVCRQTPFARLQPLAEGHGWTVDDIARETGCGAQCGLCRPYLKAMLATGRTTFTELITEE